MTAAGVFEGQRYELIEGDLIDKMGQNPPHARTIMLVLAWLVKTFGVSGVRCQLPIEVGPEDRPRTEPEPDFALLADPETEFADRHPRGDELLLLVEIADSSSRFDRTVKKALYARAEVKEYWVIDISARVVYVHRHPSSGTYQVVIRLAGEETVAPESREDARVRVRELLPPNYS